MLMFRFWGSDSRGSEKTVEGSFSVAHPSSRDSSTACDTLASPAPSSLSPRKRRQSSDGSLSSSLPAKRPKIRCEGSDDAAPPSPCDGTQNAPLAPSCDIERARDEIRHQFGLEILLKHDELRLINQELAKCQVALEQLRRCHLIPYPVSCPTPNQMLDISSGKGPAVGTLLNEPVPQWAPPFGVVDGPYARHYAKWLIPDPVFDGMQAEWQPDLVRARGSASEGRTTRNSCMESGTTKGRPGRGLAGHKLQALPTGYPAPKEKAGPCILKRADGQTVKLVCLDCHRDNFSSTQGFINHCRIAHKRDFKSHEEAAVHCGQPIDAAERTDTPKDDKASVSFSSASTSVHPFARQDMTEQEAYKALRSRISDSLELYHRGKLPGVSSIPSGAYAAAASCPNALDKAPKFGPSLEVPYLSRLMKSRRFTGNLQELVADAKTKMNLEDIAPGEESDELESSASPFDGTKDTPPIRTPVVMRMPARSAKSPGPIGSSTRPASSKGRAVHMSFVSPSDTDIGMVSRHGSNASLSDEDLDMEDANLSPNTLVSNNAPSLVSDDGEYDDSDEGSSVSGASDHLEADSVSDVAEITLDDEHEPRPLRRGSSGITGPVRLRKDDAKHVTFIGPVKSSAKNRQPRKV